MSRPPARRFIYIYRKVRPRYWARLNRLRGKSLIRKTAYDPAWVLKKPVSALGREGSRNFDLNIIVFVSARTDDGEGGQERAKLN